jgi:nitroreductase
MTLRFLKNLKKAKKFKIEKSIEKIMMKDLVVKNRSYRRFKQEYIIKIEVLKKLVNLARLSASANNLQPLKFILSHTPQKNTKIFQYLSWAGHLKDWDGPEEGEKPSAYIIIVGDKKIAKTFWCNHGIAAQSILLGATEMGLGGCMIGSIDKEKLRKALEIPSRYEILLVLALGKPNEQIVLETVKNTGNTKYWRDKKGIHHVPKRELEDIIIL